MILKQKPKHKPPKHLSASTKRWFISVLESYELEPHHVRLLTLAAEAWDRTQCARETLALEGLFYKTASGEPRRHPACDVERDNRIAFARIVRELDLDVSAPAEARRPPELPSIRRA